MKNRVFVTVALAAASLACSASPSSEEDTLPDDFQQIIPRGRIAAINDPKYVRAEEARIEDDSFVLGIVIDGQARAYSLNLLNAHEVVNDEIGDTKFSAVW